MAIRPKPQQTAPDPKVVQSFIDQGGTVAAEPTAEKPSGLNLPTRKPAGKRSNPEYKGHYFLIHEPTFEDVCDKLRKEHKGTDVSDLINAFFKQC